MYSKFTVSVLLIFNILALVLLIYDGSPTAVILPYITIILILSSYWIELNKKEEVEEDWEDS